MPIFSGTIGNIQAFLNRSPYEHSRQGVVGKRGKLHYGGAVGVAYGGVRDSSYGLFQTGYHRFRANIAPKGSYEHKYRMLRSQRGLGHAAAVRQIEEDVSTAAGHAFSPGPSAAQLTHPFSQGLFWSGVGFATAAYESTRNPWGPLWGYPAWVGSMAVLGAAAPLGWGLGKAAGMAGTRFAGRAAASIGARIAPAAVTKVMSKVAGSIIGRGIGKMAIGAGTLAFGAVGTLGLSLGLGALYELGVNKLPQVGFRLSRKGFGNLYGRYQDTQYAATMRQQALSAISQSQMNARNALGGEAALLHLT